MSYHSPSLANPKLQAGMNAVDRVLRPDKPEQCPRCLSRIDCFDIRILVHRIPIVTTEVKLWAVTRENWSAASAGFGAYECNLSFNIRRISKLAI